MDKIAYVFGGTLSSGKTFLIQLLFPHLKYIAPDQFIKGEWTKQKSDMAWDKTHALMERCIKDKRSFVLDTAQAKKKNRHKLVKFIHQKSNHSYTIVLIHAKSPLKDCLLMNQKRENPKKEKDIKEYFNIIRKNPYSKKDGYDHIITIDNSIREDNGDEPIISEEKWEKGWYHG